MLMSCDLLTIFFELLTRVNTCNFTVSEITKLPNGIIDMGSLCTLSLKVHLEIHVVRLTPTSATSHFKTWTWNFMPRGFDHWFWNSKWFLSCSFNGTPNLESKNYNFFFHEHECFASFILEKSSSWWQPSLIINFIAW